MIGKYCPFSGFDPPCERCMMALRKREMLFCCFAWESAVQTHDGRGKVGENYESHAFGPWIENGVVCE